MAPGQQSPASYRLWVSARAEDAPSLSVAPSNMGSATQPHRDAWWLEAAGTPSFQNAPGFQLAACLQGDCSAQRI